MRHKNAAKFWGRGESGGLSCSSALKFVVKLIKTTQVGTKKSVNNAQHLAVVGYYYVTVRDDEGNERGRKGECRMYNATTVVTVLAFAVLLVMVVLVVLVLVVTTVDDNGAGSWL